MSLVHVSTKDAQQAESDAIFIQNPFDFGLVKRNAMLAASGFQVPKFRKTGTTIAGLVYNDGVVLGADTRATEGSIICDKECEKIHYISKYIYCCGAGTAADTENVTRVTGSQLELHRLATGKEPKVVTALTRLKQRLFQYQGHVSAALVLGGVDSQGGHIYTVYPHGSTDRLPFATMGSGSLAAMAVFEHGYRDDMDEKSAVDLMDQAIQSGIFNDLGSGGNVNILVISKTHGVKNLKNYYKQPPPDQLQKRAAKPLFPKGSTTWIAETKRLFQTSIQVTDLKEQNVAAMMEVSN